MKNAWTTLLRRIDARSLRERAMLLAAALAAVVLLADTLFIEPARRAYAADQNRLSEARTRLAALQHQESDLQGRIAIDPDADLKARLTVLRNELAQADAHLAEAVARFISPAQMSGVLRALVTRTGGLQLEGLRSLPATRIGPEPALAEDVADSAPAAQPARTQVWKRGVELQLRGDYKALLAYLQALEQLPWLLNWDLLAVSGEGYPGALFTLRLHTLSLEEDWIGV